MSCPICDQKPANCDCTETEKRQWSEMQDLRLTEEEREAVATASRIAGAVGESDVRATLRALLARLGGGE